MAHRNNPQSDIFLPLQGLKGVGESLSTKLARLDLHTIEDLLYHLPVRYEDRRHLARVAELRPGTAQQFYARVVSSAEVKTGGHGRRGRNVYTVLVEDDTAQVVLKWFNYRRAWMEKSYRPGRTILAYGEAGFFNSRCEILHPEVEFDPKPNAGAAILPVYPLTEGISQKRMRALVQQAVSRYCSCLKSAVPAHIRCKRNLMDLNEALHAVHTPDLDSDLYQLQTRTSRAHASLIYDEFFYLQMGLALRRQRHGNMPGRAFKVTHRYTRALIEQLPFKLTPAQIKVLGEIKQDMLAPAPMHRLLQGDVGSGKTVVALLTALIAAENLVQSAVIAPTEILAQQHYKFFSAWLPSLNLNAALLCGSTPARERQSILQRLQNGELHILIGTHALLEDDVVFKDLGLGIIDEQHRFGVQQRNTLRKKGENPDILVMTATPIPRTLSMSMYGDLNISIIDALPLGRIPIVTRILPESKRAGLYNFIREQAAAGFQTYFIYPLVEESEDLELTAAEEAYTQLSAQLGDTCKVGLLHGRMHSSAKEATMTQFKNGEFHVLVATTVIEVGIDVPSATIMVIEHAERFGLAQLHQLRGRVGRGEHKSYCFLFHSANCSAQGLERLKIMQQYRDGFNIAEADLNLRGPGEFLGTQQSGLPEFRVADLVADSRILEQAREDAFVCVSENDLQAPEFVPMLQTLKRRWAHKLELAGVG